MALCFPMERVFCDGAKFVTEWMERRDGLLIQPTQRNAQLLL